MACCGYHAADPFANEEHDADEHGSQHATANGEPQEDQEADANHEGGGPKHIDLVQATVPKDVNATAQAHGH